MTNWITFSSPSPPPPPDPYPNYNKPTFLGCTSLLRKKPAVRRNLQLKNENLHHLQSTDGTPKSSDKNLFWFHLKHNMFGFFFKRPTFLKFRFCLVRTRLDFEIEAQDHWGRWKDLLLNGGAASAQLDIVSLPVLGGKKPSCSSLNQQCQTWPISNNGT